MQTDRAAHIICNQLNTARSPVLCSTLLSRLASTLCSTCWHPRHAAIYSHPFGQSDGAVSVEKIRSFGVQCDHSRETRAADGLDGLARSTLLSSMASTRCPPVANAENYGSISGCAIWTNLSDRRGYPHAHAHAHGVIFVHWAPSTASTRHSTRCSPVASTWCSTLLSRPRRGARQHARRSNLDTLARSPVWHSRHGTPAESLCSRVTKPTVCETLPKRYFCTILSSL